MIHLVERVEPYWQSVRTRLLGQHIIQICSDLTRLECRVKPLRDSNQTLLSVCEEYFSDSVSEVVGLSRDIVDEATQIRARYQFKTADAIHLAAALYAQCDVLLTNDHRLGRFSEITVEVVSTAAHLPPGRSDNPSRYSARVSTRCSRRGAVCPSFHAPRRLRLSTIVGRQYSFICSVT